MTKSVNPSSFSHLPPVRGQILENVLLAPYTWLRVGGAADYLFIPADEEDLSLFLAHKPEDMPVTVLGVGSNSLVRDGGIRGVVVRPGPGFAKMEVLEGAVLRCGVGVLDSRLAKKAAEVGLAGLEFYGGIPGTVGGALRMNAGCYGSETKDVLLQATALDHKGRRHVFSSDELGYRYRHCGAPEDLIFTEALFQGEPDKPEHIKARMSTIQQKREKTQPIREKTGGSTFKNPEGEKAWQLIDSVGGRGQSFGDAQFSEQHCNFLINKGHATAYDLEFLAESVRKNVKNRHGIELSWEIKRLGEAFSPPPEKK